MPDPVRLALGTFTVLRVPPPRRVDAATARGAMLLAPLVGLLLGLAAAAVLALWRLAVPASGAGVQDLLGAALAVAALALLTRALHLDGLADTADGLGSGRRGEAGVAVMRSSDIGPFGVVTLVLVLLVEVSALAACAAAGNGTVAILVAVVTGRTAVVWACRRGVPAAGHDGLGAAVAGSVPVAAAVVTTLVVVGGASALAGWAGGFTVRELVVAPAAVLAGLLASSWPVRRAVARFGGITGDVCGAAIEVATATALVVLALA